MSTQSHLLRPLVFSLAGLGLLVTGSSASAGPTTPDLVSTNNSGTAANESSYGSAVSADGQFVAFTSLASDLVADDTNGRSDVFVRDIGSDTTERVSITTIGGQADEFSKEPAISGNGRYITFISKAQLAPADSNSRIDVYVHDRQTHETVLVSANRDGEAGDGSSDGIPDISADGRYVAFTSSSSDLTDQRNRHHAVFVRDLQTETTELISVNRGGNAANRRSYAPSISAGGRFVTFFSKATNLAGASRDDIYLDVFIRDRTADSTRLVSVGRPGTVPDGDSMFASISNDGRVVSFSSAASNLVKADSDHNFDVFVRNLDTRTTRLISVRPDGSQARRPSTRPTISPDGGFVGFTSEATLVPGETNDSPDAYLWDRAARQMELISEVPLEFHSGDACYADDVARRGRTVSFQSSGAVFAPIDTNYPHSDIYLHTR